MKQEEIEERVLPEFPIDVQRDILDIINDTPSLVKLGDKEYRVKDMRYYSLYRICRLVMDMRKADETLDTDQKVITALCTDLDAMSEIMAIVLCNHLFTPDKINTYDDALKIYNKLYKAQDKDNTCDKHPRHKLRDDATIVCTIINK